MVKKKVKKKSVRKSKSKLVRFSPQKINTVVRRLIFFVILFVLFLVLELITSEGLWNNFFWMGELIFGFISTALLIVLLILWLLKLMKK